MGWKPEGEPEGTHGHYEYYIHTDTHGQGSEEQSGGQSRGAASHSRSCFECSHGGKGGKVALCWEMGLEDMLSV